MILQSFRAISRHCALRLRSRFHLSSLRLIHRFFVAASCRLPTKVDDDNDDNDDDDDEDADHREERVKSQRILAGTSLLLFSRSFSF